MCGIIGYTGYGEALPRVIKGLYALEYRGYDSCGASFIDGKEMKIVKTRGRVSDLEKLLEGEKEGICVGIGHTRWATHGSVSQINAHPHMVGSACIVHNGIIENYAEIKAELLSLGYTLKSETDTEVLCGLIDYYFTKIQSPHKAIKEALSRVRGSYALGIMFKGVDGIFAVRRDSPLVLARGNDGYYLASDLTALIPFTRDYYLIKEGEVAEINRFGIKVEGNEITGWKRTELTYEGAQKNGYDHFMLKEIYEQSEAIKKTLSPRIKDAMPCLDGEALKLLSNVGSIDIVACGSAMHAGLVGKRAIEALSKVQVGVYVASEYRYSPPLKRENSLCLIISQSGETADSLASLRYARSIGQKTLAIVNVPESTIAREADYTLYTYAGPEIAVATTKGYSTQLALLYLLAICLGKENGSLTEGKVSELTTQLLNSGRAIDSVLEKREEIKKIAKRVYEREDIFFIGRGVDYDLCQEGSLKLKEISYIHSEAYPAGELKHGTISLIENGTPVIAIATDAKLLEKTENNLGEVKSRGALTILICQKGCGYNEGLADLVFEIEADSPIESLFGVLLTTQLLAYEVSLLRGCDIDKPRNLAKSVTVE